MSTPTSIRISPLMTLAMGLQTHTTKGIPTSVNNLWDDYLSRFPIRDGSPGKRVDLSQTLYILKKKGFILLHRAGGHAYNVERLIDYTPANLDPFSAQHRKPKRRRPRRTFPVPTATSSASAIANFSRSLDALVSAAARVEADGNQVLTSLREINTQLSNLLKGKP